MKTSQILAELTRRKKELEKEVSRKEEKLAELDRKEAERRLEINKRFVEEIQSLESAREKIHDSLKKLEEEKSKTEKELAEIHSSMKEVKSGLKEKIQELEDRVELLSSQHFKLNEDLQQKQEDLSRMKRAAEMFLEIKNTDEDTQKYLRELSTGANADAVSRFLQSLRTLLQPPEFPAPKLSEPSSERGGQDGDLHKKPFTERLKFLKKLRPTEHIKFGDRILCKSEDQLRKAIEKFSKVEGSEGAFLKLADFKYELDRKTNKNIKFKVERSLDAKVIKANKVKGSTNTYYYHCALRGPKGLHYCGKTFNTNIKANVGDIIKVIFVDISGYTDPETGKRWVNWWAPRVSMLRTDKKVPDHIDTAWRMVEETTGRFEEKPEPKIMKEIAGSKLELAEPSEFPEFADFMDSSGDRIVIKFLGTIGEGVKPKEMNRKHPGILISYKGKKLLIDCGEEEFLKEDPNWILLSHGHPDHIAGLSKGFSKPVFLQKSTLPAVKKFLLEDVRFLKSGKEIILDSFKILPFQVVHSQTYPTVGFKITVGGKSIIYSSDCLWIKDYRKIFRNAFLLIGDGSALRIDLIRRHKKTGKPIGHASLLKIYRWAKDSGIPHVIFTHLGDWIHKTDPILAFEKIDASSVFDGSEVIIDGNEIYSIPARRPRWRKAPPKLYPKERKFYADPLNWKYPISTRHYAKKAYEYFKRKQNYQKYTKLERKYIRNRIKEAWHKLGLSPWKEFDRGKKWVIQAHWRSASCHGDLRFQWNHYLIGFTLAIQEEIAKDIVGKHWRLEKEKGIVRCFFDDELFYEIDQKTGKVLKDATQRLKDKVFNYYKSLNSDKRLWKIDLKTGEELERPAPEGREGRREKIWASEKAREPYAWVDVEGITRPREIEEAPGGTRYYPGVFIIIDKGTYYPGAQKPYYREFFLNGKNWKGRIVLRLVSGLKETKKKLTWLYWKPDDQTPYVLGKRAVKEHWLPKSGSAMPPEWEEKIPEEFRFWKKKTRKEKLLARAEAINYLIDKGIITKRKKIKIEGKDFRKGKFILTERSWKGQCLKPYMPVLTETGWKRADEIKVGDRLLSSNDEYSKVLAVGRSRHKSQINIYPRGSRGKNPLKLSPNHPVLTRDGWKRADQLEAGEEISVLGKHCSSCGNIIPYWYKDFCKTCLFKMNAQPKSQIEETKKKRALSLKNAHETGRHPGMDIEKVQRGFRKWLNSGGREMLRLKAQNQKMTSEIRDRIRRTLMKTLEERGFKSKNRKEGTYWSSLEKIVGSYLSEKGYKFVVNKRIGRKYVDFFLEDERKIIEVDGSYSHKKDGLKRWIRDTYIKERFPQFEIIHLPEECVLDGSFKVMIDGGFHSFCWHPIAKIERKDLTQPRYFISIETEQGSFVTKHGILVHNTVIRNVPVSDYHIKINGFQFHLNKSPLYAEEIAAGQFEGDSGFFEEGRKEPQTKYNPNKKIPAFIKILDSGTCSIFHESQNTIKVEFKGKKLSGEWVFYRTSPKDPIWSMTKSSVPKSFLFMCKDFEQVECFKTSKDLEFPYKFKGIAFAEGTWHHEFYPWRVIRKAAPKLEGTKVVVDHTDLGVLDTIGEVTKVIPNDQKRWLEVEGIIFDTEKGKDTALLIENKKIGGISVRLTASYIFNDKGEKEAEEILNWEHLSFVVNPEVSLAKVTS